MSKKSDYFDIAKKMYIDDLLSFKEISKKLPVCERTIKNWAAEGSWTKHKQDEIKARTTFSDDVFIFTQKLMNYIEDAIESGGEVSQSKIYLLNSLLDKVQKIKSYEREIKQEKGQQEKSNTLKKETMDHIRKEILGL